MKKLILFLLVTTPLWACPSLNGQYLCPKEAEDHFYLGTRRISFEYRPDKMLYALIKKDETTLYTIDHWSPVIGTNTFIKAECSDETVSFIERFDATQIESLKNDSIIETSLEVTQTPDGIHIERIYHQESVFELDCLKI